MFKSPLLLTLLLAISSVSQADTLCRPTTVTHIMVKSNGDIIFYDFYGVRHLAFQTSSMPIHLAEVIMIGLTEAMITRSENDVWAQASYIDGYDCKKDDLTTPPLRILFDQTIGRYD